MRWLLDTNVVSEGISSNPNATVLAWLARNAEIDAAISIVTLAELRNGLLQTKKLARRRIIQGWIESEVSRSFENRILPLTLDVLIDWLSLAGQLRARGRPQSAPDLLIAATARVHGLILVTRNVRDFARTGVTVYDPFTSEIHRMEQP